MKVYFNIILVKAIVLAKSVNSSLYVAQVWSVIKELEQVDLCGHKRYW